MQHTFRHLIIATTILIVNCVLAQNLYENYIYGYITDVNTGKRLPGMRVEVINQADTSQEAAAWSDISGRYVILLTDLEQKFTPPVRQYNLGQNYPNPFNPNTVIPFSVARISPVRITIYNVLGQKIVTLLDQRMTPGNYSVSWDGMNSHQQGVRQVQVGSREENQADPLQA